LQFSTNISKTVQNRDIVTTEVQSEVADVLQNGVIAVGIGND